MNPTDHSARSAAQKEPALSSNDSRSALNVVGVYQDPLTQSWTSPMCNLVTQLAQEEFIQNAWYEVSSLRDAGMFLEAVQAAREADVIVVSIYAAEELPLELYVWIDVWLPRRHSRTGALAALIGVADPPGPALNRTFEYLQAVARRAELDFIPQERLFSR